MKDFKIYFSIATLVLIIYMVAQYNKPSPINWQPTMYYNDKVPFGTYILYRQLPQLFPGAKIINTNQTLRPSSSIIKLLPTAIILSWQKLSI